MKSNKNLDILASSWSKRTVKNLVDMAKYKNMRHAWWFIYIQMKQQQKLLRSGGQYDFAKDSHSIMKDHSDIKSKNYYMINLKYMQVYAFHQRTKNCIRLTGTILVQCLHGHLLYNLLKTVKNKKLH
jgi:hypothetical protein